MYISLIRKEPTLAKRNGMSAVNPLNRLARYQPLLAQLVGVRLGCHLQNQHHVGEEHDEPKVKWEFVLFIPVSSFNIQSTKSNVNNAIPFSFLM